MSLKNTFLFASLLISSLVSAQSQPKFTISGTLKDSASGEELIGVVVGVKEIPTTGVTTNEYGFYSLTLNEGNYTLIYNYMGYRADSVKISLHQNIKQNIKMASVGSSLQEVKIQGTKS